MKSNFSLKNKDSKLDAAYKVLKSNVQFLSLIDKHKVVLVTSALPKDGKTTIAKNLSIYLAKSNNKTLLIDFNFTNSNLHKSFNVSNDKGISDILTQVYTLNECIKNTEVENLYFISCGTYLGDPIDLLLNSDTKDFFENIKNKYDYIIIDSPSVLSSNYIKILASLSDSALFVACYGKTDKDAILKSKQILNLTNCPIIGSILNKTPNSLVKNY